jgi:hypothetical protein
LAKTEVQHEAAAEVLEDLAKQKKSLAVEIVSAKALVILANKPEAEVEAALAVLGRLPKLVADQHNLAAIGKAFGLVNLRLFLKFKKVQVKKRTLNRLDHGVVTFGEASPPVPLYAGPTGRRAIAANTAALVAASPEGDVTLPDRLGSGREDKSLGNVNRGDRI